MSVTREASAHGRSDLTPGGRALADEMAALTAFGVRDDPAERLRLGAAAMSANVRRYASEHGLGPAWVAKTIAEGGIPVAPADDGLTERDRVRCAAFDELMAERGLSLAG